MRIKLFILCLLLSPVLLMAQNATRIESDPAYIWAEGTGSRPTSADDAALEALAWKLAATHELPADTPFAVWKTYLPDLRAASSRQRLASGVVLRYIAWKDIPLIFEPRWRKVQELASAAEQAEMHGKEDVARTYCSWAEVYLRSLPPVEQALRDRVSLLRRRLGEGEAAAVKMRNVEVEVAGIRSALEQKIQPVRKPALPDSSPEKEDSISRPQTRMALIPVRPALLPQVGNILPSIPGGISFVKRTSVGPAPIISPRWQWATMAVADIGRTCGFGALVSGMAGRFGGYLSARSSFTPSHADYDCLSDGTTDFGYIWTSSRTRGNRIAVSGGGMVRALDIMRVYMGAGYGRLLLMWEDTSLRWARVTDLSEEGLLTEFGVVFDLGRFSIILGTSSVRFRDWSVTTGLGFRFSP